MSHPSRRTWTTVSDSPEIVRALSSANLQIFRLRHALRQFPHTSGEIVENPMHPGTSRCIRVVHINANALVPGGGSFQESAGETSAPSHVNFGGIPPPFENAVDLS